MDAREASILDEVADALRAVGRALADVDVALRALIDDADRPRRAELQLVVSTSGEGP